jgi:hypothetical protein
MLPGKEKSANPSLLAKQCEWLRFSRLTSRIIKSLNARCAINTSLLSINAAACRHNNPVSSLITGNRGLDPTFVRPELQGSVEGRKLDLHGGMWDRYPCQKPHIFPVPGLTAPFCPFPCHLPSRALCPLPWLLANLISAFFEHGSLLPRRGCLGYSLSRRSISDIERSDIDQNVWHQVCHNHHLIGRRIVFGNKGWKTIIGEKLTCR